MIVNPEIMKDKYACREKVMRYLVFKCHLPVLAYGKDMNIFYFSDTEELRKCLKEMPLYLKVISIFTK
jgi:hypothetical protein